MGGRHGSVPLVPASEGQAALPRVAGPAVASRELDGQPRGPGDASAPAALGCDGSAECITCSDQAVACRVIAVDGRRMAVVERGTVRETVSVALVDALPGDVVMVHAGEAIALVAEV